MHFHIVDFGGKMLARSLKNIWTDEKLVYLCSAKDKMVSNLTTILQYFKVCNDKLLVFAVSTFASCFFFPKVLSCHFKTCMYIKGGYLVWVKSGDVELSHWLQAILFRARGGIRSGEEHQGVTSSPALSLHPPRACLGLMECARQELSSWPFSYSQSVLKHTSTVLHAHNLYFFCHFGWRCKFFTLLVILSDTQC